VKEQGVLPRDCGKKVEAFVCRLLILFWESLLSFQVERILPRGRPRLHLYEVEMSENAFVVRIVRFIRFVSVIHNHKCKQKEEGELKTFLNMPAVEGVYETKVAALLGFCQQVSRFGISRCHCCSNY